MNKLVNRGVEYLLVQGRRRGVVGSSKNWLGVYVAITAARQVHRLLGKEPSRVERVVLKPGQSIVISDTGEPWGKRHKR